MQSTIPFYDLVLSTEDFENPRLATGLDPETIKELADDIEARGLLYPLLVWQPSTDPGSPAIVLGGQRRYRAIEQLILEGRAGELEEAVPVLLYDADSIEEARAVALADGLHRKQLSSYEVAQALSKMSGSQSEIARRIGKSKSYVSEALAAWSNAGPTLQIAWRDNQIPYSKVKEIASLPAAKQAAAVADAVTPSFEGMTGGKKGPKGGRSGRPGIKVIKAIVAFAKDYEPETGYEQGLIDMARFVTTGESPKDDRWRKYLEE